MVLAAGVGRRLRPHTDNLPKALIQVDGEKTILDIALENLASVGIDDVVLVVGCAAEDWNNANSMWTARELMGDGVLLLNGDGRCGSTAGGRPGGPDRC